MEITYKVVGEKNENHKLTTIEKRGHTVVFTLEEVEAYEAKVEKLLKEKEGQKAFEEAKMQNVKDNHPEIAELSPLKLRAAYIYAEAQIKAQEAGESADAAKKVLAEYKAEKDEIMKALGFVPVDAETLAPENANA